MLSVVMSSYATNWHGRWWEWLAALIFLTLVFRMALDRLELGWKSHLEHPRH